MTSDSTRWPLLKERAPFATAAHGGRSRKLPRSAWLLTGLAFLCGGLVSAAGFSIGWRHQAQRDNAAQTALAAATARTHRLQQRTAALQASLHAARGAETRARATAAAATAAERALAGAGARVAAEAATARDGAGSISSGAGSLTAATTRIASELKTLDTYLTTTPAGELDPGYVSSQASYLTQQLTRLQGDAGNVGDSIATFEAAARKLAREAAALKRR